MKALIKTCLLIILTACVSHNFAQNLVPNGDFENYTNCPTTAGATGFTNEIPPWNPVQASPDYFNACDIVWGGGVPVNSFSYQNALSGVGYAGFYSLCMPPQSLSDNREYISIPLKDTLEVGKPYLVSFYVNRANSSQYATNTIGAYFSNIPLTGNSNFDRINVVPQIENNVNNNLVDTLNWMLIQDTLVAQGGESYMTIGNFRDSTNSGYSNLPGPNTWNGAAYYYIDDVSVIEIGSVGVKDYEKEEVRVDVYPNPSNEFIHAKLLTKESMWVEVCIKDVMGKTLSSEKLKVLQGEGSIDVSNLPNGVYYLTLNNSSRKFVVLR